MPPTSAPERTGASGNYYVMPPPPKRMMSPAGYLGLGIAMLITVFIVLGVVSSFKGGVAAATSDGYEEVDLGQVSRDLAPEGGGLLRDAFMVKVVLVLNPKARDLASLRSQVERRRNLLRDILFSEILNPKSDADLRKPQFVESLKAEIRQRFNKQLGPSRDGLDVIESVIFPERRLPERR